MRLKRHTITARDYEGYGVYERDFGRSLGGSYELAGMDGTLGQLPSFPGLDQVQMVNGLAHVPLNMKMAAKSGLELLTFQPTSTSPTGVVTGKASYVMGSFPTPWVDGLAATDVVMVQRSSVPSGEIAVAATFNPAEVVALVGHPDSDWVILDASPPALAAAEAYKAGGGAIPPGGGNGIPIPGLPQPGDPCPPGTTGSAWPQCLPQIPGIPGTLPPPDVPIVEPPEEEKKKLPAWALPAALGAGALVVVGVVALGKKKRRPAMTPNRGRYRAWG